jgi:hypothetical protein
MIVLGRLGRLGVYTSQPSTCRRLGISASQSQCLYKRGCNGWVSEHPQLSTPPFAQHTASISLLVLCLIQSLLHILASIPSAFLKRLNSSLFKGLVSPSATYLLVSVHCNSIVSSATFSRTIVPLRVDVLASPIELRILSKCNSILVVSKDHRCL